MQIGIYHFDGDPDELIAAYERLSASISVAGSAVQVCTRRDGGLPQPRVSGDAVHDARTHGSRL
jgi:hypothetical protein